MPEDLDVKEIARQDAIADKVFNDLGLDAATQRVATHQTLSLQDKFNLTGLEQEFRPPEPVSFAQGFMVDVASGIYNGLIIETASGLSNLAPTVGQALGADSEFLDSWITNVSDFFEDQKMSYSDDAGLPINEFKDITSSHVAKGIGEGVGFIAAMFAGGGALGASAKATKALGSASKASAVGGWLTGTALMYGSIQQEAKKAGLSNGDAARFALGLAGVIGATEQVSLGYLGKLSKGFISKIAQKEAINVLKTATTKNPVALQKLFLGGLGKAMSKTTGVAKGAAAEFTQEFSQTYIEEGAKQLWDEVYKDEKGKDGFGSDITNYQSFVEATFAGLIGGLLGGGMVSVGRGGVQEEGLFGYINNSVQQQKPEMVADLRGGLETMMKDGRLSEKQFNIANESITELENFAKDVKPKGITDGVANYQLFQLNKLGKQSVKFAEEVNPNNEGNPSIAKDYANRQGMIKEVQASINSNFESIFDSKKALTKNKDKFEAMLSDYGKLLTDIKNKSLSKEDFDKRLAKFEVKAKKETETEGDTKEDVKPVEGEISSDETIKTEVKEDLKEAKEGEVNPYLDFTTEDIKKELDTLKATPTEATTELDTAKKELLESALATKVETTTAKEEEEEEAVMPKQDALNDKLDGGKDEILQKEGLVKDKADLASKNPKLFKKVADKFKKLFPSTPVEIVDKIVDKNGAEVLGRVYKAGIQISKDKAVQTTLIHENAEVFLELLGTDNKVVEAGFDLIRDTEYHKKAKEAYPELSEKGQLKEALIESLSQSTLEDLKTRFEGTKLEKFQAFLKRFWNRTKAMFNADDRNAMEMLRDDLLLRGEKVKAKKPKKYVKKDSKSKKAADKDNAFIEKLAKARQVFTDFGRTAFGSIHTKSLISNNPKVAGEIVDELKRLYPKLKVNKDGIVKDGRFVPLKEGEKGMHIRNAFESMVAWANDAYLETPPHEYAHAYIEMYSEHPLVKEAIKKYGSIEAVATIMGRHYAGKKVSNSFKTWLDKFWNMIKSLVGSPDIGYKLSEAFMKGEKLSSTEEPGFNTIEYQTKTPFKRYEDGVDTSGFTEIEFKPLETKDALSQLFGDLKEGYDYIDVKNKIIAIKDNYKEIATDSQGEEYRNTIDKRLLKDLTKWISEDKNAKRVVDYLEGKNEFPQDTTNNETNLYESIITDLVNAEAYEQLAKDSVVINGKLYPIESLGVNTEISEATKKRKALYAKIKSTPLRKAFQHLEKVLPYLTNSRLTTKYLSGSASSVFSSIYYGAIRHGEGVRDHLISEFNDKLMDNNFSEVYSNWSAFKNKKSTIGELDTKTIKTQEGDVEITMAELLTLYMVNRRKIGIKRTGNDFLLENGLSIVQEIEGRDIPISGKYTFTKDQLSDIVSTVENDPDMMKNVKNITSAMKFMGKHLSKTFLRDNGIELGMEEDFFPISFGEASLKERRSKKSVDDFKSNKLAMGSKEPVMIMDVMQILGNYKINAAVYSALAIPIKNNRKIIQSLEKDYREGSQERVYLESLKETLNQLEDPSQLFSGQGEKKWMQTINRFTSNFAVSVLGMNLFVQIKQAISFITAANVIDGKYLAMAGGGISALPVINPKAILKAIFNPIKKGSFRWDFDTTTPQFEIMKKWSHVIKARIEGLSSREMGEALLGQAEGSDTITTPWKRLWGKKKGERIKFSKSRFMEGIRVFDAVTIENLWRAAEFEAEAEYGLKRGTDKFYEHVAIKVENIIAESQPTFNLSDRTGLAKLPDPLARFFTQFSSATSKMSMLQIDGMLDFIANPTKENQMKLIKRSMNILVTTALLTASLDAVKGMLLYGYDDDDELIKETLISAAANNIGLVHVLGQAGRVAASQLDDKPWFATAQTPTSSLVQTAGGVMANVLKGNPAMALNKSIELAFKASGMPMSMVSLPRQSVKRVMGE